MACVFGDMNIVRPLGLAGIPCAPVAAPGKAPRFSRYTHSVVEARPDDETALLDNLERFADTQDQPPVLYFQNDADALFIARHRERLDARFRVDVLDVDRLEEIIDKVRFQRLAERLGLPVPRTVVLDTSQPVPSGLPFPLVLKPTNRVDGRWQELTDSKALRVDDDARLRAVWPTVAAASPRVLAQQLVEGDESRIESHHVYVDPGGDIAGEFTGRKIRTWPREHGFTTALEITDTADVRDLGRDVLGAVGLRGVAKIDFKRDPDGRLHLLEINPRFNLWHLPGALAGVNLPALVWADLTGGPRPATSVRAGTTWCRLQDVRAARRSGIGLVRWLAWLRRCDAVSSLASDDLGLVARQAGHRVGAAVAGRG